MFYLKVKDIGFLICLIGLFGLSIEDTLFYAAGFYSFIVGAFIALVGIVNQDK